MQSITFLTALAAFFSATSAVAVPAADISEAAKNTLEDRQYGACSQWSSSTQLVGNGDPHQNYLHKQLSQTITCDQENGCSTGQTETRSYTIGFSITGSPAEWISGGFDVSTSWTTGNSYTCNGGPGDTVCVFQKIAHTAYTVQNGAYNSCTGFSPSGGTSIIKSPNNNNSGGGYYCVVGTCRNQGDEYWEE
ncbi:hypothetical protein EJ05DRAFT_499390 [Pseudovirgaria hyperparasitica]|uniref:Ig-like domain-containing protein n=1 Tax=Pseudovirgaria hyperparasitica TaxID=470096 RepID=A0A6A6WAA3_9PEZI|nr:uncharacterized protein EJ05DRAFT_499390 [Pseudovirgaria hyperparasitica]KAF2758964.1 hypothetical protein EJ05DRAFT_499390 [Pseudovirgaria hyperparasitica]